MDKVTIDYKNCVLAQEMNLLKEYVNFNTQSKNTKGIEHFQIKLSERFEKMGFLTHLILNPEGVSAPLLVAEKLGTSSEFISFIGHSDTVGNPEHYPFHFDDHRIYGAGVADDKAGLVVLLEGLSRFLKESKNHHYSLRVIISPNEELGSIGFHEYFRYWGENSKIILGFEPGLHDGSYISSRSGNRWINLKIEGISAHSGRMGESHLNALHELARIINSVSVHNDDKKRMRINFNSVHTDKDIFNTISGDIMAKIDMRFDCVDKRKFLQKALGEAIYENQNECPETGKKPISHFSIEDDCPPLQSGSSSELETIISLLDKEFFNATAKFVHSGGAADINYFSNKTNHGLDGLGPIGGDLHSKREYIERESLTHKIKLLKEVLTYLDENRINE